MKKRWNKLTTGVLLAAALLVGGWMLAESLNVEEKKSTVEVVNTIDMNDVLVVRP